VTEAFRIAAAEGLHAAMTYLEHAVPSKRWRTDDVRRMLGNRAYLGEARLGGQVKRSAHPALTTLARWNAAQTEPRARRSNGHYPLREYAICGRCGAGMVGALQTVRGKKYRRMRCSANCAGGNSIGADLAERHVRDALRPFLNDEEARKSLSPAGEAEAKAELEQAEDDRARWGADDRSRDLMGDEAFYAGLEERARVVREAEERYRAIASRTADTEPVPYGDELDDPGQLERALRRTDALVRIHPGRGAVGDRVEVTSVLYEVARMLAA
jgi:hypothetical protein